MKIAIFVEGLTELEFVQTLIKAVCGKRDINFEIREQYQGRVVFVRVDQIQGATTHVMIVNCRNDEQVKTQMRDQYAWLVSSGYSHVIGLRDVYPFTHAELPMLQAALTRGLPDDGPIPAKLHLAVLEVEAWFLDEVTHFQRIDPALTVENIMQSGFDVANSMGASWVHPARTLDDIYRLAGKRYRKRTNHIRRTLNALSYEELYLNVRQRAPSFDEFLGSIEQAIF